MLRIEGADTKGRRFVIPDAERIVIRSDAEAPADSFEGRFSGEIDAELAEIFVYKGEELVFEGLVDEQIEVYSSALSTEIAGRSFASLLLDNEAMPQSYSSPSLQVVFKRYLEPLGFELSGDEGLRVNGEFKVTKGMSCYGVLEEFLKRVGRKVPHIKGRIIDLREDKGQVREFSHKQMRGTVKYTSLEYALKRCELLSEIRVRTTEDSRYGVSVFDEDACGRGVTRIRYLNASMQGGLYRQNTENMIKKARLKEKTLRLVCPGFVGCGVSQPVAVTRKDRVYEGFCVGELKYILSEKEEFTRITLVRM